MFRVREVGLLAVLSVLLPVIGWSPSAQAQATQPAGVLLEVPALTSPARLPAPRLFYTQAELLQARKYLGMNWARGVFKGLFGGRAREDWAIKVYESLLKDADEALGIPAVPLDEGWWELAKGKRWEDTYPEVYVNTSLEPMKRAKAAATLATVWLLSGDERYAAKGVELLMALAAYSFRAEHFDVGMNYAGWGWQMLIAYDVLGARLSPEQSGRIDACMTRLARAVVKNDEFWIRNDIGGGINNHLAWHKMILGLLGIYYSRPEMVDYCVNGPRGLLPLLGAGLLDDGLWRESSLTYQFAAIVPMLIFADVQRRVGEPRPLHGLTAANGRTLKQSLDAMLNVLAPDGLIPPVGDAYGARVKLWDNPAYEYGWSLYRDPVYAWMLRRALKRWPQSLFSPPLEKGRAPRAASILLPEHGYAFLRSAENERYWGSDAWCAFLTYDRSSVHANADKLSLMLFGMGRMLVSDVEAKATVPHAFSSRVQSELNRCGLSQNTVMIDGADQRCGPRMLRLVEFHDLPEEKRVTAADEEGLLYEGVRQMRSLIMTPQYVLDVFQVDCGSKARQIDWIAHIMDQKARLLPASNAESWQPFDFPGAGAYPWLRSPRSFRPAGPFELGWDDGIARLRLRMNSPGAERVILCSYPGDDTPASASIPMIIVRQHAQRAAFIALWLIGSTSLHVEVRRLADEDAQQVYEVRCDGQIRRHFVPPL